MKFFAALSYKKARNRLPFIPPRSSILFLLTIVRARGAAAAAGAAAPTGADREKEGERDGENEDGDDDQGGEIAP